MMGGSPLGYGIFIDFLATLIISALMIPKLESDHEKRIYSIFDRVRFIYNLANTAFSIVVTNSSAKLLA